MKQTAKAQEIISSQQTTMATAKIAPSTKEAASGAGGFPSSGAATN